MSWVESSSPAWFSSGPVVFLSVLGGYLPTNPDNKWIRRWPSMVHITMLAIYVGVFSSHVPPQTQLVMKQRATEKFAYTSHLAMSKCGPWLIFAITQIRIGRGWKIIRELESTIMPVKMQQLKKNGAYFIMICVIVSVANACYEVIDMISMNVGSNPFAIAFAFVAWHCELIFFILPTLIAFLAYLVCQMLQNVNRNIADVCKTLISNGGDKTHVKLELQQLSKKWSRGFDLVREISEVYGMSISLQYLISVLSIIESTFYTIVVRCSPVTMFILITNIFSLVSFTIVLGSVPQEATSSLKELHSARTMDMCPDCEKQVEALIGKMSCEPVQITAANFFAVNRGLITSIAGAVTTYIIVLAQFNDAD